MIKWEPKEDVEVEITSGMESMSWKENGVRVYPYGEDKREKYYLSHDVQADNDGVRK